MSKKEYFLQSKTNLCCKCNLALGGLDVDLKHTELLYKAIKYIEDNDCA